MGQYYKPVILDQNNAIVAWAYSHDWSNGLKLMEHSYRQNDFVGAVVKFLSQHPFRLVWAGDYADPEKDANGEVITLTEKDSNGNDYTFNAKLYNLCDRDTPATEAMKLGKKWRATKSIRYAVNFDKKQWVDFDSLPKFEWTEGEKEPSGQIHALPLLTAEGNQRGGGDYYGASEDMVGIWARDLIQTFTRKSDIPKDFTQIFPKFIES